MTGSANRADASRDWSIAEAEDYLLRLELFGMRFGLDRMRRLLTALGTPQERFASVHVVGTNGKSSTTRMIAAILEEHGVHTGTYLSPHLVSFAERVRVADADDAPERFARAVQTTARAADKVNRTGAGEEDHVTQFEALTAAAFWELAASGVDTAVIEAGLGGRWDATNVLPSLVQVLTNVGLEHTRWLGPTVADIAGEKLDVVTPGGTLVVGEDLHPDARALAERVCAERGATLVVAEPLSAGLPLRAVGAFQRANFAVARTAARAALGARPEPIALDPHAVARAAAATLVPGRFQLVDTEPDTFVDGAHNPAGMVALVEAIAALRDARRTAIVLSVLDDKDAGGMLRHLRPVCDLLVCTTNPNPRSLSPATLVSLAGQLGFPDVVSESESHAAVARAREAAGPGGLVVATGSIYLIADLLRPAGSGRASTL